MNLLAETVKILTKHHKQPEDVKWVGLIFDTNEARNGWFTWDEFAEKAKTFDYHESYGSAEVSLRLVVVGADWWLERGEYDGSEWWEFKQLPTRPAFHKAAIISQDEAKYCSTKDGTPWEPIPSPSLYGALKGSIEEAMCSNCGHPESYHCGYDGGDCIEELNYNVFCTCTSFSKPRSNH